MNSLQHDVVSRPIKITQKCKENFNYFRFNKANLFSASIPPCTTNDIFRSVE